MYNLYLYTSRYLQIVYQTSYMDIIYSIDMYGSYTCKRLDIHVHIDTYIKRTDMYT